MFNECISYIKGMRTSKYRSALSSLLQEPFFMAEDAREYEIPSRMLSCFCEEGIIERIGRGIYRAIDAESGIDLALRT